MNSRRLSRPCSISRLGFLHLRVQFALPVFQIVTSCSPLLPGLAGNHAAGPAGDPLDAAGGTCAFGPRRMHEPNTSGPRIYKPPCDPPNIRFRLVGAGVHHVVIRSDRNADCVFLAGCAERDFSRAPHWLQQSERRVKGSIHARQQPGRPAQEPTVRRTVGEHAADGGAAPSTRRPGPCRRTVTGRSSRSTRRASSASTTARCASWRRSASSSSTRRRCASSRTPGCDVDMSTQQCPHGPRLRHGAGAEGPAPLPHHAAQSGAPGRGRRRRDAVRQRLQPAQRHGPRPRPPAGRPGELPRPHEADAVFQLHPPRRRLPGGAGRHPRLDPPPRLHPRQADADRQGRARLLARQGAGRGRDGDGAHRRRPDACGIRRRAAHVHEHQLLLAAEARLSDARRRHAPRAARPAGHRHALHAVGRDGAGDDRRRGDAADGGGALRHRAAADASSPARRSSTARSRRTST